AMASIAAPRTARAKRSRKDALPLREGDLRREALVVERAAAPAHRRGALAVRGELLDRARQRGVVARRDDVAEVVLADDARELAVVRADEEHRPRHREDAVELARHDQAFEPRLQRDEVRVAGGEALAERLARLVRREESVAARL